MPGATRQAATFFCLPAEHYPKKPPRRLGIPGRGQFRHTWLIKMPVRWQVWDECARSTKGDGPNSTTNSSSAFLRRAAAVRLYGKLCIRPTSRLPRHCLDCTLLGRAADRSMQIDVIRIAGASVRLRRQQTFARALIGREAIETESGDLHLLNPAVWDAASETPQRRGSWLATDKDREGRPRRRRGVSHFSFASCRHQRKMSANRCTPHHSNRRWP